MIPLMFTPAGAVPWPAATPLIGLALVATALCPLAAHDQIPGQLPGRPVAIVGGTVYRVDAPPLPRGVVVLDGQRIAAVGPAGTAVPEGAELIDAEGLNVYPGLINAYSDIGLREIDAVSVTVDTTETGRVNPNVRSWVAINPDSELIPVARSGGVLTSLVAPQGPYLAGQAGVVRMDGWTWQEMLLRGPAAMVINWDALERRGSSGSVEEQARARQQRYDQLDELLATAGRYVRRRQQVADDQPVDVRLEALAMVLEGQLPLVVSADRRGALESAVAWAAARDLRLVIYGGYDAAAAAELLSRHDVPVILPGTFRLPLRRDDPYDAPYTLPAKLQAAGVRFCMAAERSGYPGGASNARNLPHQAGNAVAYGLDAADALRAITLSAAEILGVEDRVGSLAVDKEATLLIVQGDILQVEARVEQAFIHGRPVDLGNKQISLYRKYQEKYRQIDQR